MAITRFEDELNLLSEIQDTMLSAYVEAEFFSEKRKALFRNADLITRVMSIIHRHELSLLKDEST